VNVAFYFYFSHIFSNSFLDFFTKKIDLILLKSFFEKNCTVDIDIDFSLCAIIALFNKTLKFRERGRSKKEINHTVKDMQIIT
jgi:hypothetical protein